MTDKIKVIVKFKTRLAEADMNFMANIDAQVKDVYPSINAVSMEVPKNKIGMLQLQADVEYVEMDGTANILGFPSTDVLPKAEQIPWGIAKIRAPEVHATGNKGTAVKVCIIDTGIDYNHEDFKYKDGSSNYKGGHNFINNTTNPMDDHGHGTHVSGIVAAIGNNDIGVIGVAPEAHIYSYKVLNSSGSGSYSAIISAIQMAIDNKMQVISMSLGGSSFSQALKDICDAAYNAGIIIMAAAGNSGGDGSQDNIGYPAKFDSCIAIAATDSNDNRASFSSTGPKMEIAAPGVNVLSTVPKSGTTISDPSGYKMLNGTSMSTPHISGVAALVIYKHPDVTNVQVRDAIDKGCIDLGQTGRDVLYGFGRIDAVLATGETPPPTKKYACSGAPNYACTEDPTGPYNSIEECQTACKEAPPTKKYKCSGAPNYECVEDINGNLPDLATCQKVCITPPPPTGTKFKVHKLGSLGVTVLKTKTGDKTAEQACQFVCDILKTM